MRLSSSKYDQVYDGLSLLRVFVEDGLVDANEDEGHAQGGNPIGGLVVPKDADEVADDDGHEVHHVQHAHVLCHCQRPDVEPLAYDQRNAQRENTDEQVHFGALVFEERVRQPPVDHERDAQGVVDQEGVRVGSLGDYYSEGPAGHSRDEQETEQGHDDRVVGDVVEIRFGFGVGEEIVGNKLAVGGQHSAQDAYEDAHRLLVVDFDVVEQVVYQEDEERTRAVDRVHDWQRQNEHGEGKEEAVDDHHRSAQHQVAEMGGVLHVDGRSIEPAHDVVGDDQSDASDQECLRIVNVLLVSIDPADRPEHVANGDEDVGQVPPVLAGGRGACQNVNIFPGHQLSLIIEIQISISLRNNSEQEDQAIFSSTFPSLDLETETSMASWMSFNEYSLYRLVNNSFFSRLLYWLLIFSLSSFFTETHQGSTMKPVMVIPVKKKAELLIWKGLPSNTPYTWAIALGFKLVMMVSVTGPPPRASYRQSKPSFSISSLSSFSQSPVVMSTWVAPSFFNRSACSCFLTMLRRGIFSFKQSLFNILPRAEAAAVWIIPLRPNALKFSTNPTTVSGLTMPEAADETDTSLSSSKQVKGVTAAYSHHEPDRVVKQTLLPTQDWTASPLASTTVPVPSSPQMAGKGFLKQWPAIKILSEGLIVEASTLTSSSPS